MNKRTMQLTRGVVAAALALPAVCFGQAPGGGTGGVVGSVVIYGRIHAGIDRVALSGTSAQPGESLVRVSDNSSKFGFRGSEDLGGGLSALFQIEGGAKIDDGTGALNSKDSFVGLASKTYGRLLLGRFATPIRQMNNYSNRFLGEGIQDDANISQLGSDGFNRRSSNSISYQTPSIGPFSATLYHASENEAAHGDRIVSAMLQYGAGALKGGLGYESHKNVTPGFTDKMVRLAGNYQFGGGDVGVAYNRMIYHIAAGSLERDYFTVTGSFKLGGGALVGRYGIAGDVSGTAPNGASVNVKGTALVRGADSGAQQATLGYEYNLSRRSQVYTYYTRTRNDRNANYTFGGNSFATVKKGATVSGVMLGVVHVF